MTGGVPGVGGDGWWKTKPAQAAFPADAKGGAAAAWSTAPAPTTVVEQVVAGVTVQESFELLTCGFAFQDCNRPYQDLTDIQVSGWQQQQRQQGEQQQREQQPPGAPFFARAAATPGGGATMKLAGPLACEAAERWLTFKLAPAGDFMTRAASRMTVVEKHSTRARAAAGDAARLDAVSWARVAPFPEAQLLRYTIRIDPLCGGGGGGGAPSSARSGGGSDSGSSYSSSGIGVGVGCGGDGSSSSSSSISGGSRSAGSGGTSAVVVRFELFLQLPAWMPAAFRAKLEAFMTKLFTTTAERSLAYAARVTGGVLCGPAAAAAVRGAAAAAATAATAALPRAVRPCDKQPLGGKTAALLVAADGDADEIWEPLQHGTTARSSSSSSTCSSTSSDPSASSCADSQSCGSGGGGSSSCSTAADTPCSPQPQPLQQQQQPQVQAGPRVKPRVPKWLAALLERSALLERPARAKGKARPRACRAGGARAGLTWRPAPQPHETRLIGLLVDGDVFYDAVDADAV